MQIALKVDVDTLKGTLEGVPNLLKLFDKYGIKATFLLSLGPDNTGRALLRIFRPGFLAKVFRTSVTSHYGLKTLLYGTLIPGPNIGKRAKQEMQAIVNAGHEVGIHCYDHVRWQDFVAKRDATWTEQQMQRAADAFLDIFGRRATVHGAAGWQLNSHALRYQEIMGLSYASDVRGEFPFLPIMDNIEFQCPQIPTTLPTIDELVGREGITEDNVHETIFRESRKSLPNGHVFTLHAEMEGLNFLATMEKLIVQWQAAGDKLCTMYDIYQTLDLTKLKRQPVIWQEIAGRSGVLATQGTCSSPSTDKKTLS